MRTEWLCRLAPLLLLTAAFPDEQPPASAFFQPGKIRALILSGRNNHDWRATTPYLRDLLVNSGRFDVRVVEEPAGLTESTLAAYDVLIADYNGPRWGAAAESAVEAFVRSGKGLVGVHAASYAFGGLVVLGDKHVRTGISEPPWPAWAEMTGGAWSEAPPKTGHGKRHSFTVKFKDKAHPIAMGLPETFEINDELYHNMRMKPNARVLATAWDNPAIDGTGRDEPILWTVPFGRGRVFHTTLGHDVAAMQAAGFGQTFVRGAEWAANRPPSGQTGSAGDQARQPPVRVRVVVGGHDHEPSFHAMFEGQREMKVMVDGHPSAYPSSILKSTDVLVMYDMVDDVPEAQRKVLMQFLESGKGLVAVHHSIASYQDWPWYRELIGGMYFRKPETGHAGSTYLHDVDMKVTAVGKHPILEGVALMEIHDETYKGMWISPKATVLLRTDHPTSDGPLAWISPYEKSRVVYIQLGHGREAHEHPGFRRLVRSAVLWVAGRQR